MSIDDRLVVEAVEEKAVAAQAEAGGAARSAPLSAAAATARTRASAWTRRVAALGLALLGAVASYLLAVTGLGAFGGEVVPILPGAAVEIASILVPLLAIVGAALVLPRPLAGGICMLLGVLVLLAVFGLNLPSLLPAAALGIAAILGITSEPATERPGVMGWLHSRILSSPLNIVLTVAAIYVLYVVVPPVARWAFIDANWQEGTSRAECVKPGACWTMVRARFEQFIYGFYPADQRWRVDLIFLLFFPAVAALLIEKVPGKRYVALFLFVAFPIIAFVLLYGIDVAFTLPIGGERLSVNLAMPEVRTSLWGGLMLTLVLAIVGIVASLPIGILLALGRRSTMPAIRLLCTAFIELVRAVPLITVLFMASVMLPLFLPEGVSFDKLLRAMIGISLFGAAYMAEVVRGGLQAIPKGQYEGAMAMGLGYWPMMRLIVLPQALRIVIPGIVNSFIGLFMDTTLVLIIGFFELLGIVQQAARDANWIGLSREGFVFAAVIYFVFCFTMSRYSIYLERRLHTGHKRR